LTPLYLSIISNEGERIGGLSTRLTTVKLYSSSGRMKIIDALKNQALNDISRSMASKYHMIIWVT
jgi:hypothetical protein